MAYKKVTIQLPTEGCGKTSTWTDDTLEYEDVDQMNLNTFFNEDYECLEADATNATNEDNADNEDNATNADNATNEDNEDNDIYDITDRQLTDEEQIAELDALAEEMGMGTVNSENASVEEVEFVYTSPKLSQPVIGATESWRDHRIYYPLNKQRNNVVPLHTKPTRPIKPNTSLFCPCADSTTCPRCGPGLRSWQFSRTYE